MSDDILDAQAAVDWAVSQIPLLQDRFLEWNKDPYEIVIEPDPDRGGYAVVAYQRVPFPLTLNAWVGAIINSLRSSLDLLAAALARRNGNKPSADTHFPIFASDQDMIDPLTGIEGKKWLSKGERATVKSLNPYQGGDDTIWPLHQLDILRKHERLISASPDVSGFLWQSGTPGGSRGHMIIGGHRGIERLENKTILFRSQTASDFDMTQGDTRIAAFVTFNETGLALVDQEVATVLLRFGARVAEIVKLFDR